MTNKIELNDEVIKYYDQILKKSKDKFTNKKYDEAIQLIEDELNQPYIPFEYEQIFENQLFAFQAEYRYLQIDEKYKLLDKNQMLKQIVANNKFNVYLFDFFIQKFNENLDNTDFDIIGKWLIVDFLSNYEKFYILDALAHFKIEHKFILFNHFTNDDVVLNTIDFHEHECFTKYNQVLEIIEQQLIKDPSIAKFASDLLNAVATHYFPTFEFQSTEKLANIILKIISNCFNFIEIDPNSLSEDERKVYNIFLSIQNTKSF